MFIRIVPILLSLMFHLALLLMLWWSSQFLAMPAMSPPPATILEAELVELEEPKPTKEDVIPPQPKVAEEKVKPPPKPVEIIKPEKKEDEALRLAQEELANQRLLEERQLALEEKKRKEREQQRIEQEREEKEKKLEEQQKQETQKREDVEKAAAIKKEQERKEEEKKKKLAEAKKREEAAKKEAEKQAQEEKKKKVEAARIAQEEQEQRAANEASAASAASQRAALQAKVQQLIGQIQRRVQQRWIKPVGMDTAGLECVIEVRLLPDGSVATAQISKSSGNDAFDRSAITAVYKSSPMPVSMSNASDVFDQYFRYFKFKFRPQ